MGQDQFLTTIRPPYFDTFYFVDTIPDAQSYIAPHVFFKILFHFEGDITYEIEGTRFALVSGDVLILPRYTPYQVYSHSQNEYRRAVIWFTSELVDSIDPSGQLKKFFEQIDQKKGLCLHFPNDTYNQLFTTVVRLAGERDYVKSYHDTVSYSLISLVLIDIYRAESVSPIDQESTEVVKLVNAVVHYINSNLLGTLTLDLIAEHFFISKFYLERIFKQQMGVTVHNYIVQRRLTLARQKMYNGDSPGQVYKQCGFMNYATFYRAFQKKYHTTPKEFSDQAKQIFAPQGDREGSIVHRQREKSDDR